MTKLYVTEFPGVAMMDQGDSVDIVPEPATVTTVLNTAATTGTVASLGAITAGTLYTNGTYTNVPLTGGTGSGATANITVAAGGVSAVTIVSGGTGYTAADSLSASAANIGGTGSGFVVAVSTITQQVTLQASTQFVELEADGVCSFVVGQGNPVATTSNARIPANNVAFRRRIPLQTGTAANPVPWKLSAVTNT